MKVDYISDLHVDHTFVKVEGVNERGIRRVYDDVFRTKDSDILIIAGDTANSVVIGAEFIKQATELYGYKRVFVVTGNHEMYMTSQSQDSRYKTSYNKLKVFKDSFKGCPHISVLDGEVEEYKGIVFGGAMGWYDTSYDDNVYQKMPHMYSMKSTIPINKYWQQVMNDSRFIKPITGDYRDISTIERAKVVKAITTGPDVMITHICPITSDSMVHSQYKGTRDNTFYMFDGEELVEEYKPKFWIYGHQHISMSTKAYDTELLINPHGYPNENRRPQVKTFEINKE